MMEYKGYIGDVTFDSQAHLFHGEVINTRDVITFQGTSVDELEAAFHDSVDDYLQWCSEEGGHRKNPTLEDLISGSPPDFTGKLPSSRRG